MHARQQAVTASSYVASGTNRITRAGRQGFAIAVEQSAVNGPVFTTGIYEISIAGVVEPDLIDAGHIDHSACGVVIDKVFVAMAARRNLHILVISSQGVGHTVCHLFRLGWRIYGI